MTKRFSAEFTSLQPELSAAVTAFGESGKLLVKGKRNSIRIFDVGGKKVNVKSFRVPIFINRIIYGYFRKSKARRSFEFAERLLALGIGTPQPIAYFENRGFIGLADSYYASEHLFADFTFKELVSFPDFPDHENILRQFTAFCVTLHNKGVEFLDHSPGNTLIVNEGNGRYGFYLVDLNRMEFHDSLSLEKRMKNLSRLTPKREMVEVMADEYARHSGEEKNKVFELLWGFTEAFQEKFRRKKELKKRFGI